MKKASVLLVALALAMSLPAAAQSERPGAAPLFLVVPDTLPASVRSRLDSALQDARAHPRDAAATGRLAMLLHAFEQYRLAADWYEIAGELEREAFAWPYLSGVALAELGEAGQAADRFRRALVIDPSGRPVPVPDGGSGAVLYRGPMSVCGCSTSSDLGFGFRAFPFVGAVPGRMGVRIYAAPVTEAVMRMPQLWKGAFPLPHDHQWLLTACRMRFSHPVPFQIAGDPSGFKTEVDYRLAERPIDLVDWRAMA